MDRRSARATRPALVLVLACLLGAGCAAGYWDAYRAEHPGAHPSLPAPGQGLFEVLAALDAPAGGDVRVWSSRREVLRLSADAAERLDDAAVAGRLRGGDDDLAVLVVRTCLSEVDLRRYRSEKVSWLLLEGGRLSAWDLHEFGARCVVSNDFRPAAPRAAALEDRVRAFRDASLPGSMVHPAELYAKGLRYLAAGRRAAAREMLERGDRGFDVSAPGRVRFEAPSDAVDVATPDDAARLRARLVAALGGDPPEGAPPR